ncbi:conserved hypothetical protein [Chthoniobacter flavus Ellin428]|uniref:Transmembrane protein n=1 Tax=Chthoniobacter flavus Ellin428 TaxID=497964 RepID=B4D2L2_9BACT|nr:hypothetical protein [Chthoniobacter flavus]EDY19452.1 conserved hypothetical protein [Chthoniobacter flavus Ellin428]TCO90422.1 hypothetical protein EV701_11045 [Chthoniobacter flavus]
MNPEATLRRYRLVLGLFILGLVLSGVTAFPLLHELELLGRILGIPADAGPSSLSGLQFWIATVRDGLRATYASYPWLAYGTDWLAFGHITIALFFIGPWREPVANAWVLKVGLVACAGILPLALICGPLRGIPIYWRLIDCSFGIFGCLPLLYCLRLTATLRSLDSANRA